MLVSKEFKFCASHILPRHPGKCSELHGHNWTLIVEVHGDIDSSTGFVMDYNVLSSVVDPLIKLVDHKHLNCFCAYPSSENMLIWFAHELIPRMPAASFSLYRNCLILRLCETDKTLAEWNSSVNQDILHLQDAPDAEWRSPSPGDVGGQNPIILLDKVKSMLPDAAARYFELLTLKEQLGLYISTINWEPKIPGFVEQGKSDDRTSR